MTFSFFSGRKQCVICLSGACSTNSDVSSGVIKEVLHSIWIPFLYLVHK